MLFMVIERFRSGDAEAVAARFRAQGRMLPDGLVYRDSWMDPSTMRCFQVVETANPALLRVWTDRWSDLVDFEIVPVVPSVQFWASPRERSWN